MASKKVRETASELGDSLQRLKRVLEASLKNLEDRLPDYQDDPAKVSYLMQVAANVAACVAKAEETYRRICSEEYLDKLKLKMAREIAREEERLRSGRPAGDPE